MRSRAQRREQLRRESALLETGHADAGDTSVGKRGCGSSLQKEDRVVERMGVEGGGAEKRWWTRGRIDTWSAGYP